MQFYHSVTVNVNGVLKNLMVPVEGVLAAASAATTPTGTCAAATVFTSTTASTTPSLAGSTLTTTTSSSAATSLPPIRPAPPTASTAANLPTIVPGTGTTRANPRLHGTVVLPMGTPKTAITNILSAAASATRPGVPSQTVVLRSANSMTPTARPIVPGFRMNRPTNPSAPKVIIVPSNKHNPNLSSAIKPGDKVLVNPSLFSTLPVRPAGSPATPASSDGSTPMITFLTMSTGSGTTGSGQRLLISTSGTASSAAGVRTTSLVPGSIPVPSNLTSLLKHQAPKTVMTIVAPPGQQPVTVPGLQNAKFLPVSGAMASLMNSLEPSKSTTAKSSPSVPPGAIPVPNLARTLCKSLYSGPTIARPTDPSQVRPVQPTTTTAVQPIEDSTSSLKIASVFSMSGAGGAQFLAIPTHTQGPNRITQLPNVARPQRTIYAKSPVQSPPRIVFPFTPAFPTAHPAPSLPRRGRPPDVPDETTEATKGLMDDADRLLQRLNTLVKESPSTGTASTSGSGGFQVLAEWSQEDTAADTTSGPVSRSSSPSVSPVPGTQPQTGSSCSPADELSMPDLSMPETLHADRRPSMDDAPPLLEKATDTPTVEQAAHSDFPQLQSLTDNRDAIQKQIKKKIGLKKPPSFIGKRWVGIPKLSATHKSITKRWKGTPQATKAKKSGEIKKKPKPASEQKSKICKPRRGRCRKVKSWRVRYPEYLRCVVNVVKLPEDLVCPVDLSTTVIPGANRFVNPKKHRKVKPRKHSDHNYITQGAAPQVLRSILRPGTLHVPVALPPPVLPSSPIKPIAAPGSASAGTVVVGSKTVPYQKIAPVVPPSTLPRIVRPTSPRVVRPCTMPTLTIPKPPSTSVQVVGGSKFAPTAKGKFYLVKTSTGSFLVPMPDNNSSGVLLKVPPTKDGAPSPQILISPKANGEKATLIAPSSTGSPNSVPGQETRTTQMTFNLKSVFSGPETPVAVPGGGPIVITTSAGTVSRPAPGAASKRPRSPLASPDSAIITGSKPGRPAIKAEPVDDYQYSATAVPDDTEPCPKLPRSQSEKSGGRSRIEELRAKLKTQQAALEEVRKRRATKIQLGDDAPSPSSSMADHSTSETEDTLDAANRRPSSESQEAISV